MESNFDYSPLGVLELLYIFHRTPVYVTKSHSKDINILKERKY